MKLGTSSAHLAYCTNIHPAETWEETFNVLQSHTLAVRDQVCPHGEAYAIGLRLSAKAAEDLLTLDKNDEPSRLIEFKNWLKKENCYVFTINGFPYGAFHATRVKENVYRPDWTSVERLNYTNQLFIILTELLPDGIEGSVSTLPGSFKAFKADEHHLFSYLYACARFVETLSDENQKDLHLGLEPEPLGHFENTGETIGFFNRFHQWAKTHKLNTSLITRRIGVNYDTCHFALEFEDCHQSLDALRHAGIRISKIHLSSALTFTPSHPDARTAIQSFDEPTYLHQVLIKNPDNTIIRFSDLPDFFEAIKNNTYHPETRSKGRVHFHIPLYAEVAPPLGSTQNHAKQALLYLKKHPEACSHFEIETYTWDVLPSNLQISIEDQITKEYNWVLKSNP